jgi:Helicase conserved C-terminal domain
MDEMYDEWSGFLNTEDALPPFEQFSLIRSKLAESRIPHLIEMVETHEEEGIPLVVFSAHKAPILELGKRPGWAVITGSTSISDRRDAVSMFQAGLLKGIALTIQAGGVGLTLTHAWKAIFIDLDWTPALNSQAADRICRIGQTKPCEIVHMVSDHPLDMHIMKLIMKKMDLFDKAIDSSIKANPVSASSSGETEEEYEARMKAASEIAIKEEKQTVQVNLKSLAKTKVLQILEHERKKANNKIVEPVITPQIMEEVKIGFDRMLSVCDGAHNKDGQGFNKPDASLSRYLYQAGFDDKEVALAGYYMLRRYPRQVGDFLRGI